MYVRSLRLSDYRSWQNLDITLSPGVTVFSGPNGHGKTNIVEALGYLSYLGSHRVNSDAALVREGCSVANVSATAVNNGRELTATLAIRAHGARASICSAWTMARSSSLSESGIRRIFSRATHSVTNTGHHLCE